MKFESMKSLSEQIFFKLIFRLFVLILLICPQTGCWLWEGKRSESAKTLSTVESVNFLQSGGDFWAQIKINDIPVGYQQTVITILADGKTLADNEALADDEADGEATDGKSPESPESQEKQQPTRYRIEQNIHVKIERNGTPVLMRWAIQSVEQADGTFISAVKEETLSDKSSTTVYLLEGDTMIRTTKSTDGSAYQTEVPVEPNGLGPNAVLFSFLNKPMRIGESRSIKFYDLMIENYASVELTAAKVESFEVFGSPANLLRIDGKIRFSDGTTIPSTYWTDAGGHIIRNEIDQPGNKWVITMVGPSEAKASLEQPQKFDPGKFSFIPVRGTLESPYQTGLVKYRVQLKKTPTESGMNLEKLLPVSPGQAVEFVNPQTAEVTVKAFQTDIVAAPETIASETYSPDDLAANPWIQSDNPYIVKMAEQAVPGEQLPLALADGLQRFVAQNMNRSEIRGVVSSAAEAAQSLSGDGMESAFLLAALARARGIPARVVVGMIYSQAASGEPVMVFHLWNELYIGGHWRPYDATLESGADDAARIRLGASNLTSESLETFLRPVVFAANNLQVEILEVAPPGE